MTTFRVVFLQQLTGGREVCETGLTAQGAFSATLSMTRDLSPLPPCVVFYFEPEEAGDMSPGLGGDRTPFDAGDRQEETPCQLPLA